MSDDYCMPSQRKSKRQMGLKRKYRVYKKGGQFRTIKFEKGKK